jgi:hypothetical protein
MRHLEQFERLNHYPCVESKKRLSLAVIPLPSTPISGGDDAWFLDAGRGWEEAASLNSNVVYTHSVKPLASAWRVSSRVRGG